MASELDALETEASLRQHGESTPAHLRLLASHAYVEDALSLRHAAALIESQAAQLAAVRAECERLRTTARIPLAGLDEREIAAEARRLESLGYRVEREPGWLVGVTDE